MFSEPPLVIQIQKICLCVWIMLVTESQVHQKAVFMTLFLALVGNFKSHSLTCDQAGMQLTICAGNLVYFKASAMLKGLVHKISVGIV